MTSFTRISDLTSYIPGCFTSPFTSTIITSGVSLSSFSETVSEKEERDRKSTRLNSSHVAISYAVFCLKKKKKTNTHNNNTIDNNLHIFVYCSLFLFSYFFFFFFFLMIPHLLISTLFPYTTLFRSLLAYLI